MKVVFRVDSNSLSGFGHFSRCLNLCRSWLLYGNLGDVLFVGNYNSFAVELLRKYKIKYSQISGENYSQLIEKEILEGDTVVFDSYFMNQEKIDQIASSPFKSILIDDQCKYSYEGIDCVINFRFDADKLYDYKSRNQLLGIQYFAVKPELVELRKYNLEKKRSDFSNVLLFLGGAFNDEILLDQIIRRINVIAPGKTVNLLGKSLTINTGEYVQLTPTFDMERILSEADVVISGGGMIKYEAAFSLVPTASFSTTELQFEDSNVLDHYNANCNLGFTKKDPAEELLEKMERFLTDEKYHLSQIESNKKNFGSNPAKNLIDKLNKI